MNQQNTEKLVVAYPKLYIFMKYFECGDGWYNIIDRLSSKLENLIQIVHKASTDEHESCLDSYYAVQVKEKFGTLRFYISCGTDEMYKCIEEAEKESCNICEQCGDIGETINPGWVYTVCSNCQIKLAKR